MTTDAGSGFDNQAAARDAGDERLEEARERKKSQDNVNDAFGGDPEVG